jgi:hypothetical protein
MCRTTLLLPCPGHDLADHLIDLIFSSRLWQKASKEQIKPAHHQQRQWRFWSKLHAAESAQIQTACKMQ